MLTGPCGLVAEAGDNVRAQGGVTGGVGEVQTGEEVPLSEPGMPLVAGEPTGQLGEFGDDAMQLDAGLRVVGTVAHQSRSPAQVLGDPLQDQRAALGVIQATELAGPVAQHVYGLRADYLPAGLLAAGFIVVSRQPVQGRADE